MAKSIKEKISWVLADTTVFDPAENLDELKRLGAFWGSWNIWRSCQIDNVVCHDQSKASELIKRNFQTRCNFYVPDSVYISLERPEGVKVYAGEFVHDVIRQEEIVALHLAATTSDIVLLYGWNLAKLDLETESDRLHANYLTHHRNMVRQAFVTYNQVTWVVVDHPEPLDPNIAQLENIVTDSLTTVLEL
jgi:hypothetical protein